MLPGRKLPLFSRRALLALTTSLAGARAKGAGGQSGRALSGGGGGGGFPWEAFGRCPREGKRSPLLPGNANLRKYSTATEEKQIAINRLQGANEGIAEIVMNRLKARNSLGKVFVSQLFEAVEGLRNDNAVRVVVFKSEVKGVFCAGADLKERAQMSNAEVGHFVHKLRTLMNEIAVLPMPTVAAVDGYALGGGLELAMACDIRVAASSAKMGLIETTRGLLPGAGGSQRLPRIVGVGLAKELIFTGRQLDGEQAQVIGLVSHAVPQNASGDAAYQKALALAKEVLPQVDIATGMAIEEMCYARVIPTKDRLEGMAAFMEKRLPQFKGE
nr:PREDICTED: enoyl-CoA hydratase domain-containing protein 2, mitochondrial [Latimeria chalumnae]|eukprot:XP_014350029.1 PREDICTED: enoyl-CoA hydratase domain-containing protein 2, mitochondrial [Latimeria chalumnae]